MDGFYKVDAAKRTVLYTPGSRSKEACGGHVKVYRFSGRSSASIRACYPTGVARSAYTGFGCGRQRSDRLGGPSPLPDPVMLLPLLTVCARREVGNLCRVPPATVGSQDLPSTAAATRKDLSSAVGQRNGRFFGVGPFSPSAIPRSNSSGSGGRKIAVPSKVKAQGAEARRRSVAPEENCSRARFSMQEIQFFSDVVSTPSRSVKVPVKKIQRLIVMASQEV